MKRKKPATDSQPSRHPPKRSPSKSKGRPCRSKDKLKRLLSNKPKPKKTQYDSNHSTTAHTFHNDSRMGARRKSSQQLEQLSKHVELLRHEK